MPCIIALWFMLHSMLDIASVGRFLYFFFMHGGVSYIVLSSVLGSVLIVAGLYLVLWGKAKEEPDVHPDEEVGKESVPAADTGEKETK